VVHDQVFFPRNLAQGFVVHRRRKLALSENQQVFRAPHGVQLDGVIGAGDLLGHEAALDGADGFRHELLQAGAVRSQQVSDEKLGFRFGAQSLHVADAASRLPGDGSLCLPLDAAAGDDPALALFLGLG